MSAILKLDKMPKSCSECKFCETNSINKDRGCVFDVWLDIHTKEYETSRHPQCPLQDTTELLEALEISKKDEYTSVVDTGFHIYSNQVKVRLVREETYNKLRNALGGNDNGKMV